MSVPQKLHNTCTHACKHTHSCISRCFSQCKPNSYIRNALISYALYTTPSAAAWDQTSQWSSRAVPPWRSLTGGFHQLSCNSEHQPRLHTMTEPDEITVCATEARAGPPLPKSCINNSVIGHRSAASLCNPRSTIILHRFVHACHRNPWTGARCNFLIDLR